jgi:hypothetical protein
MLEKFAVLAARCARIFSRVTPAKLRLRRAVAWKNSSILLSRSGELGERGNSAEKKFLSACR